MFWFEALKVLSSESADLSETQSLGGSAKLSPVQRSSVSNLSRAGIGTNRALAAYGIRNFHGDIHSGSDLESLPAADWVIDAAAIPSVMAAWTIVRTAANWWSTTCSE